MRAGLRSDAGRWGLWSVLLLVACASAPPQPPPPAQASRMVSTTREDRLVDAGATTAIPGWLAASVDRAPLIAEAAVQQQPRQGSPVIVRLPAGTVVQKLGEIRNAEGHWLSVAATVANDGAPGNAGTDDKPAADPHPAGGAWSGQGWIRAEALPP